MDERVSDSTAAGDMQRWRRRSFAIAYRMLGSIAEAEDVVQEAFLRLHRAQSGGTEIDSEEAFLVTVTTRLAIDHLRSARVRRETYTGTWFPEPLVTDSEAGVEREVETSEALSMAFLLLLENLSPAERAVFLLRQVFDYDYEEISRIVGKSEANCRQLFARAKRRVGERRPRFEPSRETHEELTRRFFAACQGEGLDDLVQFLASDAEFSADGGGKAAAVTQTLHGSARIAALLRGIFAKGRALGGHIRIAEVNGSPGAVLLDGVDHVVAVMSLEIEDDRIQAIRAVVNPDKLQHLGTVSDIGRLRPRTDEKRGRSVN